MTNNSKPIPKNVTSYDTGNIPYKHDVGRGKWESTWDFYAVALSHCLGFRHFILYFILLRSNALLLGLAYTIGLITVIVPLYFTQMFLGQFSSTGFISAFRIAPLFKGIGYISLILNISTSSYMMVTAGFPLFIIFQSFQPYLPWSHCDNHYNTEECTIIKPGSYDDANPVAFFENKSFPIREYMNYILHNADEPDTEWFFSWQIMLCTFVVCGLIGLLLYNGVETFGKILRFTTCTLFVCLILTTIRIMCKQESWIVIREFFSINLMSFNRIYMLVASPLLVLSAFGVGWGNILTIASYNNFREDIGKLTIVVCSTQMIVFMITSIGFMSVERFLMQNYSYAYLNYLHDETMSYVFVSYAFYFQHLGWPNFWTIMFFTIIFISQISEVAIQMLSILTAIYDGFEYTRIYKKIILFGLIGFSALMSIFFCTSNGLFSLFPLYNVAAANKLLIISLELLVVLWIYGRERFQRDVKFMIGRTISSWRIWMMRFLTPLLLVIAFMFHIYDAMYFIIFGMAVLFFVFFVLKLLPIFCIPFHMCYLVYTSTGDILYRIKNLCRPTDWYPADPIERQNYEYYVGNSDNNTNDLVPMSVENEEAYI